jgi:predicted Mrr-cat superfamily restriction endonuclease
VGIGNEDAGTAGPQGADHAERLKISETRFMAAWGIHAGRPRSAFLDTGVLLLERSGVRDLSEIGPDRATIKAELARSYPDAKDGTIAAWTGVLLRFAFEPQVGDLVVHPERESSTVSVGRITSAYYWEAPGRHCRQVSWSVYRRVPRRDFSDGALREISARPAFFAVRKNAAEFERMTGPSCN